MIIFVCFPIQFFFDYLIRPLSGSIKDLKYEFTQNCIFFFAQKIFWRTLNFFCTMYIVHELFINLTVLLAFIFCSFPLSTLMALSHCILPILVHKWPKEKQACHSHDDAPPLSFLLQVAEVIFLNLKQFSQWKNCYFQKYFRSKLKVLNFINFTL